MKLLVSMLCFFGAALAMAGEDDFLRALKAYKYDLKVETPAKEKLRLADDLLKEWANLDQTNQARWSDKVFVVHFLKAEVLARSGKHREAIRELLEEWKLQGKSGGRLEYSTKSPDMFFERLVELQAELTAETGVDPLKGAVNYVFEREGEGFMASRFELWDDIQSITVPDVRDGEKLVVVHQIHGREGQFAVFSTKWLVVPEGKLRDVMKKATREITFDEDGKMVIRELK
jgi:hypothetical protein